MQVGFSIFFEESWIITISYRFVFYSFRDLPLKNGHKISPFLLLLLQLGLEWIDSLRLNLYFRFGSFALAEKVRPGQWYPPSSNKKKGKKVKRRKKRRRRIRRRRTVNNSVGSRCFPLPPNLPAATCVVRRRFFSVLCFPHRRLLFRWPLLLLFFSFFFIPILFFVALSFSLSLSCTPTTREHLTRFKGSPPLPSRGIQLNISTRDQPASEPEPEAFLFCVFFVVFFFYLSSISLVVVVAGVFVLFVCFFFFFALVFDFWLFSHHVSKCSIVCFLANFANHFFFALFFLPCKVRTGHLATVTEKLTGKDTRKDTQDTREKDTRLVKWLNLNSVHRREDQSNTQQNTQKITVKPNETQ